ncbi:MAG TPA: Na/Pi cotransporter family protein [Candidatus Faecivivens stercoripullorum]|uniref:Na/Pi cotransporter family protein n=1 Tax=Candidatus Faecivivens stercoripullorum TaxID=2840805 RepID=A0A9D1KRH0_9FIRM|nr:Na/Pi cotransporter family protein [Candidatus Faecivivens stercoripullorum]
MTIFNFLTLLGGLALTLYGMNVMGNGLTKTSGGKLEAILEKFAGNPFKGLLFGAIVTAVVQSSSATTVMVVGFVNSGIMKLTQAVGIIMGANIGTTITSWLLAMTSISSDNFLIQMLKPTSFAPILAAIGIVYIMFYKNEKKKHLGDVFLGFTILMTGMSMMSVAVAPLANVPEFTGILTLFSNPILGMLCGALLTGIIQSSAASIGILQALCVTDAITYSTALPIIMGQNIGTCVTALLSSVGASKNARRTALIHLYFNVIGTVLFMVLFYTADAFVDFAFLDMPANAFGISVIHSLFNVAATIVLFPFGNLLVKLSCMTIRDDDQLETVSEFQTLDDRFLSNPAYAIERAMQVTNRMCEICKTGLLEAFDLVIGKYDESSEQKIEALEQKVDHFEDKLGTYLVKLSKYELSQEDSRKISILLHSIGDIERMSDHSVELARSAREMDEKGMTFSGSARNEMQVFTDALRDIVTRTSEVFEKEDVALARTVEPLEQVIDDLNAQIKQNHVERLKNGECTIEMGFVLSDISTCYERLADHCSNLAVCQIQVHKGEYDTHEYLQAVKQKNEVFDREKEKFALAYHLS